MLPPSPSIADESIRPTRVEVDLGQLGRNLQAIRAHVGPAKVMAVVKANAYGHGLVPVAHQMVHSGADCLAVALLEEAVALREAGIRVPILVFGGIAETQIPIFIRNDLTVTAPSVDKLHLIDRAAEAMGVKARVHLKIDTGMGRLGMHYYSAEKLLAASLKAQHVQVEGIYSHFANADTADLGHARLQLERFLEVLTFYEKHSLPTPVRHLANSGGILQLPESHLDLVRPGILLYGLSPSRECALSVAVKPALAWKSHVAYFKVVQPGHPVSYGSTWVSDRPVRMVTIPVGYGDGYFRALSNKAQVLIRGQKYPVAGRVCMDQIMVNLDSGTAYYRDEVVLLGKQGEQEISADDLAEWAGTISYEVLTNINARVPRVYV